VLELPLRIETLAALVQEFALFFGKTPDEILDEMCTATCGSGARMSGTTATTARRWMAPHGSKVGIQVGVSSAAVPGAAFQAPPLGLPLWARPRQPGLRFRLQSGWTKVMPKTCFTPAAQHARWEAGTSGPSPFNENSNIIIAI
jgi:hypothetical protein